VIFMVQIVKIGPNEVEIGPNIDIGQKLAHGNKASKREKRQKRS
jgi:hypothetical protein